MISECTNTILPKVEEWRNQPLKKCYAFVYRLSICNTKKMVQEVEGMSSVCLILGYKLLHGKKEILGIWLSESESKNYWMQIFDEIKARGVEDIFFISIDSVGGRLMEPRQIFRVPCCTTMYHHLIRNSEYLLQKIIKFTQSLKKVYGAIKLKCCSKCF